MSLCKLTNNIGFSYSRDRIQFSKTSLKRFLKDCLDRDSLAYSPWIVKSGVAQKYGIPIEMSEITRKKNEEYREEKMDMRKRPRKKEEEDELEEGPPGKKQKKSECDRFSMGNPDRKADSCLLEQSC